MQRLRLYDLRLTTLPSVLGMCNDNIPLLAEYVNEAQRNLLYADEAGDEGWWGTWAEIAFNVSRSQPYVTMPRDIARLELVNACTMPVQVNNQFYEYLRFGNGRMPKDPGRCQCDNLLQTYSRNNVVTYYDMPKSPQYLRAYITNSQDDGKRVLFQGIDNNGVTVTSEDNDVVVQGIFVDLTTPFAQTPIQIYPITGIQKDVTIGPVRIYAVDPDTGDETLLLVMQPSETTALYRRYFLNPLPSNCCGVPGSEGQVQVTAIAKLELIPVIVDTDYLLIQNQQAIIEECKAVRYSKIDKAEARAMSRDCHRIAIKLMNGELNHYIGQKDPAIQIKPFGSARLSRVRIGMQ